MTATAPWLSTKEAASRPGLARRSPDRLEHPTALLKGDETDA
jgi:hypothetical protein